MALLLGGACVHEYVRTEIRKLEALSLRLSQMTMVYSIKPLTCSLSWEATLVLYCTGSLGRVPGTSDSDMKW